MSQRAVETAIAVWADRNIPPRLVQEQCRALEATGALDGILLADQFTNFIPRQLWTAENTPMALIHKDPDSHPDVFTMAAYIAAAAPGLSIAISTDSVRRAPAELITTMLTLANITEGRANFQIGGGEIKQTGPFGHPTNQGMSRMEDLFRIFHKFLDSDGEPFDHDGRRWKFHGATIGSAMPHRPTIYGLGSGPTLLEHTAAWADGLAVTCPPAWPNVERFAMERQKLLTRVAEHGRDPDAFKFAVWFPVLLADDHDQLLEALQNPILKWLSAFFGRIDNHLWKDEGMVAPLPEDWVYYKDFLPYRTSAQFIDDALAKVTPEHAFKAWLAGTPEEVAAQIQDYVDAGADWVCPMDYMPMILEPEAAQAAFGRSIDLCHRVRAQATTGLESSRV